MVVIWVMFILLYLCANAILVVGLVMGNQKIQGWHKVLAVVVGLLFGFPIVIIGGIAVVTSTIIDSCCEASIEGRSHGR